MNESIYVDSMIEQRRTADLNRRLEYRRIALERGTMPPTRRRLFARFVELVTHRPRNPRHQVRHA
ncbi:hypothetical protein LC082_07460 [Microbacterium esteraromaticum]|uniref:hypothetical protein n=1 Tax=Microbacterium esteraromaticum TaxID=57043 RepID=UPI001CD558D9|nr:hypothetical protein [Microbacterium esteraromaticum]MCA1306731.1 hypothetical protein [Microbacterium esteraromaticum]